jgi:hypothetical protein
MTLAAWPALPLDDWEPTYLTLHRWTQTVGKVCLALVPEQNHWWHVTFTVTPRGLATQPIRCQGHVLAITFDFCEHQLLIQVSDGRSFALPLRPMTVAEFHAAVLDALARFGIQVRLNPVPVEVVDRTPLDQDRHHGAYDAEAVRRLHRVLVESDHVFRAFRGRFLGKSSPVQFFWGAFDLAVSRYSGRSNPAPPPDAVMGEAYSHEVMAHGFWPGGDWPMGGRMPEAVYYAYMVPAEEAFAAARVKPSAARFDPAFGEFLLPYEDVRKSADPAATLLEFMESTWQAGARAGDWPVERLQRTRVRE